MAYIRTISPWRATGELRELYRTIRQDMVGSRPFPVSMTVWRIMRVFSLRPTFLRAFERCFLGTMWGGTLRRQAKEALGVTVAQTNRCRY